MMKPVTFKLKAWREAEGLTQEAAADKLGVVRRTWHMWENGNGVPSEGLMVRLYVLTRGAVEPNDFYDLPLLPRNRAMAA